LSPDLGGPASLIFTIVPFDQIRVDFSRSSKTSQLTGAPGTLRRARKHFGKRQSAQPFSQAARIPFAPFCKRQISKSCVLARERPLGFPVPCQINDWKHLVHRFTPP